MCMRDTISQIQEHGLISIRCDPVEGLFRHQIMTIILITFTPCTAWIIQFHKLIVSPEMVGIIIMRLSLIQVAEEMIKALLIGVTAIEHWIRYILLDAAQTPLADDRRRIASPLQQSRHSLSTFG